MNKIFTNLLLPLSAIIFAFNLYGQHDHSKCGTTEELHKMYESDPGLRKVMEKAFSTKYKTQKSGEDTTLYIIPVVFHILHQYGSEMISEAQIQSQLDALNQQYRNKFISHSNNYPNFDSLRGDAFIEFRLAKIDPFGNCTNGIDYIYTKETNIGDGASKINQWNRSKYLNVWTVKTFKDRPTLQGFATFPAGVSGASFDEDGVMILSSQIDPNSSILTHEIGHWLNLQHPWGSASDPLEECGDDGVEDTPETKGYPSICPFPSLTYSDLCNTNSFEAFMTFDSVRTNSGTKDLTPIDSIDYMFFNSVEAIGLSSNSTTDSILSFSNWDLGGVDQDTSYINQSGVINESKFYETKFAVTGNNLLNIDEISLKVKRNNEGVKSISIKSSIDNFKNNYPLTIKNTSFARFIKADSSAYIKADTNAYFKLIAEIGNIEDISNNDTITFRIYGWNAEGVNGTLDIDSLMISGKTGIIENFENYMDYANCATMFTKGQIVRMRAALNSPVSGRSNLITEQNQIATGIMTVSNCAPIADFNANSTQVCQGSQIQFNNQSNGTVNTFNWTFEDATPATSTEENPVVVFDSPGYKQITLSVSNEYGTNEITKSDYIYIGYNYGGLVVPETFSLEDEKAAWFVIENQELNETKFELIDGVGYNNSKCFKLGNYKDLSNVTAYSEESYHYTRLDGNIDAIITPSFDLANSSNHSFSFKYAYATDGSVITQSGVNRVDVTESIEVYVSTNCGKSWISLGNRISGGDLLTAGFAGNKDFTPNSNSLWKEFNQSFNTFSSYGNAIFKIEFTASDVSNNLYIDEIMIDGILGLPSEIADLDLNIYPNPLNTNQQIKVNYRAGNNPIELTLRNAQGQIVYNKIVKTTNAEVNHTLNLDSKLSSSCYFLEVRNGEFKTVKKVVVL